MVHFIASPHFPVRLTQAQLRPWISGRFDPEAFDPAKATKRMWRGLPDRRSERWV